MGPGTVRGARRIAGNYDQIGSIPAGPDGISFPYALWCVIRQYDFGFFGRDPNDS
jgi:hypothetical protein